MSRSTLHYHVVAKSPVTLEPLITESKELAIDKYEEDIQKILDSGKASIKSVGFRVTKFTSNYNVSWHVCNDDCLKE